MNCVKDVFLQPIVVWYGNLDTWINLPRLYPPRYNLGIIQVDFIQAHYPKIEY